MLLCVHRVNLLVIALLQVPPPQFHARSQRSIGDAEFIRQDQHFLQLLVLREVFIQLVDDALVERLAPVASAPVPCALPVETPCLVAHSSSSGKLGTINTAGKRRLSPTTAASPTYRLAFKRILDRLWRNELSARGLDQVLLAIGNREVAVFIQMADIARLEPVVFKRGRSLLRHVPIALENRRPADQHLSIRRDSHLKIGQHFADACPACGCL